MASVVLIGSSGYLGFFAAKSPLVQTLSEDASLRTLLISKVSTSPGTGRTVNLPERDVHGNSLRQLLTNHSYFLVLAGSCASCSVTPYKPGEFSRYKSEFVCLLDGANDEVLRRSVRDPKNLHTVLAAKTSIYDAMKDSWAPRIFFVNKQGYLVDGQDSRESISSFVGRHR